MASLGYDLEISGPTRRRAGRALALFVAGSLGVHVLLVFVLPTMHQNVVDRVSPLEVTLEKREPPRPLPMAQPAPRERVPDKRLARKPAAKKADLPEAARPAVASERRELAVPKPAALPEPSFTATIPEAPAAEPAAPVREGARAAAAPTQGDIAGKKMSAPDFKADYLQNPKPGYPMSARRNGEQGTVLLRVVVTREGRAASVSIEKSSGFAVLDRAAADAVKGWRFVPARRGTQPVEAPVLVPIVFSLTG